MPKPSALIIEDDADAGEVLAALLEERGYQSVVVPSGHEGIRQIKEHPFDVVFLDVMLPDIDGYRVCEQLKIDRLTNPIPIVILSALSAHDHLVAGLRVGADFFIPKPYTTQQLDKVLAEIDDYRDRAKMEKLQLRIRFDLASRVQNLHSVNELFGLLLRHSVLTEKQATQLRTAMLEVGSNAIEWGNKHDETKTVSITAEVRDDRIEIVVEDQGEGFNPRQLPHAADGKEDPVSHMEVREMLGLREGGFGIQIVRGMVDEVRYNERGNRVTLVKHLTAKPVQP
ncbi:response regulator [bacterium]|nr:response regulator [bacterium]